MEAWTSPAAWDPAIITSAREARRQVGNPGTKSKKRRILDTLAAFDIETSHTPRTAGRPPLSLAAPDRPGHPHNSRPDLG